MTMYVLPKSSDPIYENPMEKDIFGIEDNDAAIELLEKFPSLVVLYEEREKLVDRIVSRLSMERDFYRENGSVPDYVAKNIAWRSSGEFIAAISEAILKDFRKE